MINQFKIQNFKNHNLSELKALSQINLLLGKNNSGKTAALESLCFLLSPDYPKTVFIHLHDHRGYRSDNDSEEVFNSLFYNWNGQQAICLETTDNYAPNQTLKNTLTIAPILGETQKNAFSNVLEMAELGAKTHGLKFHFQQYNSLNNKTIELNKSVKSLTPSKNPPTTTDDFVLPKVVFLPSKGISEIQQEAQRFSRLEINNQHGEVIEALKIIEPRLKRITVVATPNGSMLYADLGGRRQMPLPLMGEGMLRTLSIALSMFNTQGGVVLIDEIESGLHHSVFVKFMSMIVQTARQWHDIFAATHSDEYLHAACEAMESLDDLVDLRAYRFDVRKEQTRVVDYTGDELAIAMDSKMEVR